MHKVLAEQPKRAACTTTGGVDLDKLVEMVDAAYNEYERDLLQTERSMSFMIDELSTTIGVCWERHRRRSFSDLAVRRGRPLRSVEQVPCRPVQRVGSNLSSGCIFEMLQAAISPAMSPMRVAANRNGSRSALPIASSPHIGGTAAPRWTLCERRRASHERWRLISFRTDITDLIQRKASFRLLFESNPVPMVVCENAALGIIAVNRAAVSHYGYDPANFLTKSIFDLDIEAKQNICTRAWEKMEGGTSASQRTAP